MKFIYLTEKQSKTPCGVALDAIADFVPTKGGTWIDIKKRRHGWHRLGVEVIEPFSEVLRKVTHAGVGTERDRFVVLTSTKTTDLVAVSLGDLAGYFTDQNDTTLLVLRGRGKFGKDACMSVDESFNEVKRRIEAVCSRGTEGRRE